MKKEKRLIQIMETLKGKPAPNKNILSKRLSISISTLDKYLAILKKQKLIKYLRSKYGTSFIVYLPNLKH